VERGLDASLVAWVESGLQRLATVEASDEVRAFAAEIDAALRLSWIGAVCRPEPGKRPTCDFRVGPVNVEV
jgi:hypothetical protein